MSVEFQLDPASGTPPYEQIRRQIIAHVSAGTLQAGQRLPAVRALAAELAVAAGTVARAYRELEAAEIVTTAGRNGTVISAGSGHGPAPVVALAGDLVRAARHAEMTDTQLLDLIHAVLAGSAR